jgi:hypothetical protein
MQIELKKKVGRLQRLILQRYSRFDIEGSRARLAAWFLA